MSLWLNTQAPHCDKNQTGTALRQERHIVAFTTVSSIITSSVNYSFLTILIALKGFATVATVWPSRTCLFPLFVERQMIWGKIELWNIFIMADLDI